MPEQRRRSVVRHRAVFRDVVHGIAALAAASVVFVLVFMIWPSIAQRAYDAGGRPYLATANHFVMLFLGLSVGGVVILLCARRDFVTPVIAALGLVVLGLMGIVMAVVESRHEFDVTNSLVDVILVWLGYLFSLAVVLLIRRRSRRAAG